MYSLHLNIPIKAIWFMWSSSKRQSIIVDKCGKMFSMSVINSFSRQFSWGRRHIPFVVGTMSVLSGGIQYWRRSMHVLSLLTVWSVLKVNLSLSLSQHITEGLCPFANVHPFFISKFCHFDVAIISQLELHLPSHSHVSTADNKMTTKCSEVSSSHQHIWNYLNCPPLLLQWSY